MQNTIVLTTEPFNKDGISLTSLSRQPVIGLLSQYWDGDYAQMTDYLVENGIIDPNKTDLRSVDDVLDFCNGVFEKLPKISNKIGGFDYRLAAVFKAKFLKEFKENEFQTIVFDISSFENPAAKDALKQIFLNSTTHSFIDFRNIVDDKLYLSIARRGIVDEADRLSIATARDQITLLNNFKQAKDNNYICSGFILNMANSMVENGLADAKFNFTIKGANYDKTYTAQEVVNAANMSQEEREEQRRKNEIKKQAEQEVKAEQSLTRTSLMPDSNEQQVFMSKTQIRISPEVLENIGNSGTAIDDDFAVKLYDEFVQKEAQKQQIRMQKAKEDGLKAYGVIKSYLTNGFAIMEALQKAKEQFRQEETIIFASYMLTKDLLNLVHKDAQLTQLLLDIQQKDGEIEALASEVLKKEASIKEHQAATTRKSNELNILKEEYEKELNKIQTDTQTKIDEMAMMLNDKIKESSEVIDDQARIIDKLMPLEAQLNESNKKLENIEEKYELELDKSLKKQEDLQNELDQLRRKINELMPLETHSKDLKNKVDTLTSELATSRNRYAELEAKYDKIFGLNQDLEYDSMKKSVSLDSIQQQLAEQKNRNIELQNSLNNLNQSTANASQLQSENKYLQEKVKDMEKQLANRDNLINKLLKSDEAMTDKNEPKSPKEQGVADILGSKYEKM